MHHLFATLTITLALFLAPAVAQEKPKIQFTKDQLMGEFAGMCRNPDAAFPKPVPAEKRAALEAWCACVQESIDRIPDSKLQQATEETFREYAQYKNDPGGFRPTAEYSLIRISKACVRR